MRNFKYREEVLVLILLCVAGCFAIFAKNPNIKAGVSCLFFGFAVLDISWIVNKRASKELFNFEIESKEILKDLALRGQESEYFGSVDIDVINKLRAKLIKRNRKQVASCAVLGIILIITAIICMV